MLSTVVLIVALFGVILAAYSVGHHDGEFRGMVSENKRLRQLLFAELEKQNPDGFEKFKTDHPEYFMPGLSKLKRKYKREKVAK